MPHRSHDKYVAEVNFGLAVYFLNLAFRNSRENIMCFAAKIRDSERLNDDFF